MISSKDFASIRVRFAEEPHGTRHRYLGGCRCLPCRAANSRYSCERAAAQRAGDCRGFVPTTLVPGQSGCACETTEWASHQRIGAGAVRATTACPVCGTRSEKSRRPCYISRRIMQRVTLNYGISIACLGRVTMKMESLARGFPQSLNDMR